MCTLSPKFCLFFLCVFFPYVSTVAQKKETEIKQLHKIMNQIANTANILVKKCIKIRQI